MWEKMSISTLQAYSQVYNMITLDTMTKHICIQLYSDFLRISKISALVKVSIIVYKHIPNCQTHMQEYVMNCLSNLQKVMPIVMNAGM